MELCKICTESPGHWEVGSTCGPGGEGDDWWCEESVVGDEAQSKRCLDTEHTTHLSSPINIHSDSDTCSTVVLLHLYSVSSPLY